MGCLGPLPDLTTESILPIPLQSLGGLTMQCDNHCLPFPVAVGSWTPGPEIVLNPSSDDAHLLKYGSRSKAFCVSRFQRLSVY